MTDSHGRTIDYLRISITDRCNLRCVYCMPHCGVEWIPHTQILTFEEIIRLCRIIAQNGICRIKVTGGEPLVRKGTVDLIKQLKSIEGIKQVTMTSNGILLGDHLDRLVKNGLDALNVSLDTLNPDTFYNITRNNGLDQVLANIDLAIEYGLPVKINCVPIRQFNVAEIIKIASLAREKDISVRFIELMPMGCGDKFEFIPSDEIFDMLTKEFGKLHFLSGKFGNGPAIYYSVKGFRGRLGFINAVSHEFCHACNRLRLTSDGILYPCLASESGLDTRALLRGPLSDLEIKQAVAELVHCKPLHHNFAELQGKTQSTCRQMFQIGG